MTAPGIFAASTVTAALNSAAHGLHGA